MSRVGRKRGILCHRWVGACALLSPSRRSQRKLPIALDEVEIAYVDVKGLRLRPPPFMKLDLLKRIRLNADSRTCSAGDCKTVIPALGEGRQRKPWGTRQISHLCASI